ncbi:MAG TPA: winged helix-turn-helix domain-containing protein [Nitrososphaera sp.]|nr:winged helix-turn-helix domain-containing protein [Nitrososphaera sp.]
MKNRSRYEVIAAILKAIGEGGTRNKITYSAMLSHAQCRGYLDSLTKSGIVQEVKDGGNILYKVTPKGVKFLSYYDQMKELLPLVNDEALASIIA